MFASRPFPFVAALVLLAPLVDSDGIKLRWKFQTGDMMRYRVVMDHSIAEGEDRPVTQTAAFVMREAVKEVTEEGVASIDLTYEAIRWQSESGEMMSFDSTLTGEAAKQNDSEIVKTFEPLLEAQVHVQLDPRGRVIEISGAYDMSKAFEQEGGNPEVKHMLARLFSEDSLRKTLEPTIFPDNALVPGGTWQHEHAEPIEPMGTMRYETESELAGMEKHGDVACAKIAITTKVSFKANADARRPIEINESKDEATLWFDLEKGRVVESAQSMMLRTSRKSRHSDEDESDHSESIATLSNKVLLLDKDAPAFAPADKANKSKK